MKKIAALWLALCAIAANAQQVDLEHAGKDLKQKFTARPKLGGGIDAGLVYHQGNAGSGRAPFSYVVSGNVSLSLFSITVPASFSFTNRGFNYQYRLPSRPSRLSLHPRYKWITAHLGDASMTFSPYTLNGHQFTGAGVELSPRGRFKYSVMGGQMLRPVMGAESPPGQSSYRRMGYGGKMEWSRDSWRTSVSLFTARDREVSLKSTPDSAKPAPMANSAVSVEVQVPLVRNLILKAQYGLSLLNRDVRSGRRDSVQQNALAKIAGLGPAATLYKAVQAGISYTLGSATVGAGIERIDPGYQTLGAYYFNNDLENITVNFAQALFKGKLNFTGNAGFQRDDLDHTKMGGSRRQVSAFSLAYTPGTQFTVVGSYSNFQTFTNVKPQFAYINQLTPFDNLDTLNFRQLSQNANLNCNYLLRSDSGRIRNLNVNLSFQDAADVKAGQITKGNASQFYNLSSAYTVSMAAKGLTMSYCFNLTYNTIGANEMLTLGPTVSVGRQLWKKQGAAQLAMSYNASRNNGMMEGQVANLRLQLNYTYHKKHGLGLSMLGMCHQRNGAPLRNDATVTVNYHYSL